MITDLWGATVTPAQSTVISGVYPNGQALTVYPFAPTDDFQFDRVTIELRSGGGNPAHYTSVGLFDASKTRLFSTDLVHSAVAPTFITNSVSLTTISAGNLWLGFVENEGTTAASRNYRCLNIVAAAASQLRVIINATDVQQGIIGIPGDYTSIPGSFSTVTSVGATALAVPIVRFWLSTAF